MVTMQYIKRSITTLITQITLLLAVVMSRTVTAMLVRCRPPTRRV